MTVIYRLLEVGNGIHEQYYRTIDGLCAAAVLQYKDYLYSKDLLYTDGVEPPDITVESIEKLIDNLHSIYYKWVTVTLVCHEGFTLTATEVELYD
jgi:hypothetical protein